MAEENRENQAQENEEKVQHSIGEVIQLLNKISSVNLAYSVTSKALHSKQKKLAKAQLREQAKAEAIVVCEKYKAGKEAEIQAIQEVTEYYDAEFEKITAEFEQKEEAIRSAHEKNDTEFEDLIIKEAETRQAYKQEKKSKEYKEFLAKNAQIKKDIERYEDMRNDSNSSIDTETLDKVIAGLKELASKNPLNRYAEDLKKIEARKKEIITTNKELETKLDELETNFEKMWDQLDVNKNKALADTKNKDLIKPTLGQRLSNFFSSQAKRREKAKAEAKQKREDRIKALKEFGGIVGTGIVTGAKAVGRGIASGAKTVGRTVKEWYETSKENRRERINTLYAKLTESYQAKEEKMSGLYEEVDKFVQDNAVPVPKGQGPIIESNDEDTIIEIKTEEKEKPATETRRPGNTAGKDTEAKTPKSKGEADYGDR